MNMLITGDGYLRLKESVPAFEFLVLRLYNFDAVYNLHETRLKSLCLPGEAC